MALLKRDHQPTDRSPHKSYHDTAPSGAPVITNQRIGRRGRLSVALVGLCVVALTGCSSVGVRASHLELAGVDADGNGVRDDVDRYIARLDPALHGRFEAVAANAQDVLTFDPDAPDASERAYEIASQTNRLISCPPSGFEWNTLSDLEDQIRRKVWNTPPRWAQERRLEALISGRSFPEAHCAEDSGTTAPPAP